MAKIDIMGLKRPEPRQETGSWETANGTLEVTLRELNACEMLLCEERAGELEQEFGATGILVHDGPPVPVSETLARMLAMLERMQAGDGYGVTELAYLSVASKAAFLGLMQLAGKLSGMEVEENPTSAATGASPA